ncbi:hypothetical protein [Spirulina subsalsa]|uniref:hypothetical protein n=2 Tax=Spirulinaceae TaxID=1890448 RepID=UPI0023308209|nr:hypothetical protein [Spirulina subsalsa]
MTKFWFMTYSTSAALGWVALGNVAAQAVEDVSLVERTLVKTNNIHLAQAMPDAPDAIGGDAIATQPIAAQPTVTPPEAIAAPIPAPAPLVLDVEPTPSVNIAPPPPRPQAAPRPMPTATPFIENDPMVRTAINPQTPAQQSAVRTMDFQEINRNNRSFDDLISPSTAANRQRTGGLPAAQVARQAPAPSPAPPVVRRSPAPARSVSAAAGAATPPRLQQLERDLDTIRQDVVGSVRRAPLESGLMMDVTAFPAGDEVSYFSPTNPNAPTTEMMWESVNLSTAFTMPRFNLAALKLSVVNWDDAIATFTDLSPWENAQFAIKFEDLGFGADFLNETAVSFADLATEFDGLFGDWESVFEAYEIIPVSPAWQSAIALNTPAPLFNLQPSHSDLFSEYAPQNPLTLGFKPDFRLTL